MKRSTGFTLIELVIVILIVAILAAIAIPSYSDYLRRGRITEATSALAGMRVKMEQYFQDNRTYVGACSAGTVAPLPTASDYWTYSCTPAPTATGYVIVASGQASTSMAGFQYAVDQANARSTIMSAPSTWTGNTTCWTLRKDGSC